MRINSTNNYSTYTPKTKFKQPSFTSEYEINGNSVASRQQVFTLGMLMSNFWIRDSRNTFYDIRRKNIMGKFNIYVNDMKDSVVERILQNNRIEFKKVDKSAMIYSDIFRATA